MYFPYHRDHYSVNQPFFLALVFSLALLLFAIGLAFPSVYAIGSGQPQDPPPAAPPELTMNAIQERMDIINRATDLSPEAKQKIISFYQKAIESLNRREKAISHADVYTETLKESPKAGTVQADAIPPFRATAIEQKARAMAY